jgi:hypothetical protein
MAEGTISGLNFASSALNARNTAANNNLLKQRMDADSMFQANSAGNANRGSWDTNSGMFRPNQTTPVENRGNMKMGGGVGEEQFLSLKQIKALQMAGYHVQFLD